MLPDAFGCAVANRFGNLLDDDADPFDLISEVETEKEKKKKKKEEEIKAKPKKPGQKESQKERRFPKTQEGAVNAAPVERPDAQRGMKRGAAGQRGTPQEDFFIPKPVYNESEFGGRGVGMRGKRGGRGGGGGGFPRNLDYQNTRSKREYDRHNATGIGPEEKRGGRGPWNWGSVEEAASELMDVTPAAGIKPEEVETPAEGDEDPTGATDKDKEMLVQVAMEMSLDEWKALQETSRSKSEFNLRKAENQIPSKAKVIHQSKHLEILKERLDDEANFLRRAANDITSMLDINFGSVDRPGRGGRGRGRGAPSARFDRAELAAPKDGESAPNPDDPKDFPALSARK